MIRSFVVRRALAALALVSATASADIYMFEDRDGILHFTNMAPRGRGWKRLMRTGPGKAAAPRGCPGCDRVPAEDRSPERFLRYDAHVQEAAALYQIPAALVRAVIKTESDFDPRVVSRAGARGLMQLMPGTQRDMGVRDVFDPRENLFGGVRYLRVLANRFGGDLVRTLAAYHAGPAPVDRYGGIPPYETTHLYVRMVLRSYYRYKESFP